MLIKRDEESDWEEINGENLFDPSTKFVKFEIKLPMLTTGKHVSLYVCKDEINLKVGRLYELNLSLPVNVRKSSAKSRFLKEERILELEVERKFLKKKEIVEEGQCAGFNASKNSPEPELEIDDDLLNEIF